MSAAVRLALFGVALAVAFVAAFALGGALEPIGFADDEQAPAPAHEVHP